MSASSLGMEIGQLILVPSPHTADSLLGVGEVAKFTTILIQNAQEISAIPIE